MRRVVITGMGAVSPFGKGIDTLIQSLKNGKSCVTRVSPLIEIGGLRSLVAGLVKNIDEKEIPRKYRRTMSNMSIYATIAAWEALQQSGLGPQVCKGGQMGLSIGSTVGSTQTSQDFFGEYFRNQTIEQTKSGVFFKIMNHSSALNVAQVLGITGRVQAPAAACATGCQAVGFGYEMIAFGKQDFMLCGGTDEYHPFTAAAFNVMKAASTLFNNRPHKTPRPFDRDRDGIVCSEGCGILLLESLESALQRGAKIHAEVIGFATGSDPTSIANPNVSSIEKCMLSALSDASLKPEEIDYVNAHATATLQGDIAESKAIGNIFGDDVPVSSFKGHLGHTMGASGALEIIAVVDMLNRNYIIPTLNLENVDPACQQIRHVLHVENADLNAVLKNNFALGGVNASIVIKRYRNE